MKVLYDRVAFVLQETATPFCVVCFAINRKRYSCIEQLPHFTTLLINEDFFCRFRTLCGVWLPWPNNSIGMSSHKLCISMYVSNAFYKRITCLTIELFINDNLV